MTRRGVPRPVRLGPLVVVLVGFAVLEPASAGADPLHAIRDALDAGDVPAATAAAEHFIASSPGDPRLADAQWLLALARERAGARGAAWDQYSLFWSNFPAHPSRDEAAGRADALVRRITQRALAPPQRWRVASLAESAGSASDDVGVVVALAGTDLGGPAARSVTRAAVDGARLWIWRPLGAGDAAFDPFDPSQVDRLEREFRTVAAWPIEGFVIDAALHVPEGARTPAALRAYEEIAATMPTDTETDRDRLAWTWAGMRARASAHALRRWVAAVESVNPRAGWLVRVSTAAIARPERALRELGEDLAELRAATPTAVWAIDGPVEAAHQVATPLGTWGSRLSMAAWPQAGDIVALP
jgi:hypothetical protein